jgi:6-phosphogluconolactonase
LNNIKIIKVKNQTEGVSVCKDLLYEIVSQNTVLFLSGGSTPKTLYQILAKEEQLKAGAVAMVDERYGKKFHKDSNELMIKNTQLLSYLSKTNTKFYPILDDKDIKQTTSDYDETVRFIFNHFPKSVAILGVGSDGHTAGIPAIGSILKAILDNKSSLVSFYNADKSFYKERITLSFLGLSKFDQIIVLAFGEEKKKALKLMFKNGSITQVPSRFLMQEEISKKTTLVTDQIIK